MKLRQHLQTIGILLALLMAGAALGLEIEQRLSRSGNEAPGTPAPMAGEEKIQPLPLQPGDKEVLGKEGDPIRMDGFANGRKQYDFTLKRLVLTQGDQKVTGEGARGEILGPDGKASIRFIAERATMDTITKDLSVEGQVRVESVDPNNPVAFETRDMQWLARQEQIVCPNPVEVAQPGVALRANTMTADVKLKKLKVEGGIFIEADVAAVERNLNALGKGARRPGGSQ